MRLKEVLRDKFTEEELKLVPTSFEVIGSKGKSVAIVEIPEELKSKEGLIAEAIMKMQKSVKSVLKKVSGRKGDFRLREFELIGGEADTEVVHKEYGYVLKLDPQKVYFSSREATERQRIAEQVKKNEKVLVMFSGIAPIPIAIAKKQPEVEKIYAIELNPEAHKYAEENVRINKLSHKIVLINGDVRDVARKYFGMFDRVIMPLPFGAESFIDIAVECLKKEGGIIHFYCQGEGKDVYSSALKTIKENTEKLNREVKILDKRRVLQHAPDKWKVCIDFKAGEKNG